MMNLAHTLQWKLSEDAPAPSQSLLLASFSSFYEELASVKRCQQAGTLARYLAPEEPSPALADEEYATRTSARLLALLRDQHLAFQRQASAQHIRLHRSALYVMAALADEVLLLDVDWPGAKHWYSVLLEKKMFSTSHSGQVFFDLADKLIAGAGNDPLHADLASVFLLALQLGFKGQHRNPSGEATLDIYRQQLSRIASAGQRRPNARLEQDAPSRRAAAPGFSQAYQHNITDGKDTRLAPLSAWRHIVKVVAIGYLVLSTVIWIALVYPLDQLLKP